MRVWGSRDESSHAMCESLLISQKQDNEEAYSLSSMCELMRQECYLKESSIHFKRVDESDRNLELVFISQLSLNANPIHNTGAVFLRQCGQTCRSVRGRSLQ